MNTLRKTRESRGFTQSQIAKKAEIATMTYVRYENPKYKRSPPVETAIKIADALGVENLRELWNYNKPN